MKNYFHDIFSAIRGHSQLGIVTSVNDSGAAQTVNVSTGDGVDRADVEVAQPFGFSSSPPSDGAVATVIEIGGDPGNLIVLPIGNPSARFGGLLEGEVVVYAADGSRVAIRQGGNIEIWAGNNVLVNAKTVVINATTSVTMNTPLVHVDGDLTASGDISDGHGTLDRLRGHYNGHTHGGGPMTSEPDPE